MSYEKDFDELENFEEVEDGFEDFDEEYEGEDDDDLEERCEVLLDRSCGFMEDGSPAAICQFTFGFSYYGEDEENEGHENEVEPNITEAIEVEVPISISLTDNLVKLSFDFLSDLDSMQKLYNSISLFQEQFFHVMESINELELEYLEAEENKDEATMKRVSTQLRQFSVPFMVPTIVPKSEGGTVCVSCELAPRFFMCEAESVNQYPHILSLIYKVTDFFYQESDGEAWVDENSMELLAYEDDLKKQREAELMESYGYKAIDEENPDEEATSDVRFRS